MWRSGSVPALGTGGEGSTPFIPTNKFDTSFEKMYHFLIASQIEFILDLKWNYYRNCTLTTESFMRYWCNGSIPALQADGESSNLLYRSKYGVIGVKVARQFVALLVRVQVSDNTPKV